MRPACDNPIIVQNSIKTVILDKSVKFDNTTNTLVGGKLPVVIPWFLVNKWTG